MIKESVPQKDVLNMYAPNNRASKHTEQNLTALKEETDQYYGWKLHLSF